MLTATQKKLLFVSSLGGVIEFYDFIIYALLATTISQQFFPQNNALLSLMATFATYAVGYLARPIGGLIFGHYGDTRSRKKPFMASILMMAFATLGIGLLPNYEQVGMWSPALLIVLRVAQGFSLGGELPGAITYIGEQLSDERGFACGMIFAGTALGAILGSITIASLQTLLSTVQMQHWGWRVAFLLGGLFGLMSFAYRRYLVESERFQFAALVGEVVPIKKVLASHRPAVMMGFAFVALGSTVSTLLSIYIPSYVAQVTHQVSANLMWYTAISISCSASCTVFVGWLSDRINRNVLLNILCLVTLLSAYWVYFILAYYPDYTLLAMLLGALPNGIGFGVIPRFLVDIFPATIRYTGIALCYNMGFAIFGGLTPLLATYLIFATDQLVAPAYILQLVAMLALFYALSIKAYYLHL